MNIMSKNLDSHFVSNYEPSYFGKGAIWGIAETDFHLHSTFSDGHNSPEEMVQRAIKAGYREIAITDHVRRTSDWLDEFAAELERLKHVYINKIRLYSGIEAKVIDLMGNIDAQPEFFLKVDLVLGAIHRIPKGQNEYLTDAEIDNDPESALRCWYESMMKLLENMSVDIIAHPDAILKTHSISVPYYLKSIIAKKAAEFHKVFEVNLRYKVPDEEFLRLLKLNEVRLSLGSDSHSIEEIHPVTQKFLRV
jgi:putative hydrolase